MVLRLEAPEGKGFKKVEKEKSFSLKVGKLY